MSRASGWDHPFFDNRQDKMEVIAHRGGQEKFPEETIEAFRYASQLNVGGFRVDVLELDVHSTIPDSENKFPGILVLMHDKKVDRTTDGKGRIKDFTIGQVNILDAGCRFTLDGKTYPYAKADGKHYRVPRLKKVFKKFKNHRMVIEIKQKDPSIFEALGNLIVCNNLQNQVLVASQYHSELKKFRRRFSDIATSASGYEIAKFALMSLINPEKTKISGFDAIQMVATLDEVKLPLTQIRFLPFKRLFPFFNKRVVTAAKNNNLPIHSWTVNRPEDMKVMIELGVNGIITDNPKLLLEVLAQQAPPAAVKAANLQNIPHKSKINAGNVP